MKRWFGLALAFAILLSVFSASAEVFSYNGGSPIVGDGEEYTISILGPNSSTANVDFLNDPIVEYLFGKTGIRVELELLDRTTYNEVVRARLATGLELPDIVRLPSLDYTLDYVESGLFIDLAPYYEKEGLNAKRRFEDSGIQDAVFTQDGKLYYLPMIVMRNTLVRQMIVNVDWLDKAGMEMPTNTDEFYDMLVYFRDHDMNGNGDAADEVPLTFGQPAVLASFWGVDIETGFSLQEDGTVRSDWQSDEYKAFLEYVHMLYEENLTAGNLFTMSRDEVKSLCANNAAGVLLEWGYQQFGFFRYFENIWEAPTVMGAQPLATEFGESKYWMRDPISGIIGVTKYCEHPEIAFQLLDWCYSDEAQNICLYGIENQDWEYNEAGDVVFLGEQAQNVSAWRENHFAEKLFIPIVNQAKSEYYTVPKWLGERDAYLSQFYTDPLRMYYRTKEQANVMNQYLTDITTYQSEAMQLFITGERDLSEWDDYCATLDALGIDKLTELYQEYVDR